MDEDAYKLPVVHPSRLEMPDGMDTEVECQKYNCKCGKGI
jgi:hypothetical protein